MAADRQELAREARVVGLRDFSTPSLEAVERRRGQLWTVAFIVMAALAAGLVLMASSGASSVGLFKHLPVRVGLVLLTMAFSLYVLEKERHLRRLTRLLMDERVLTAALSNRLKELATLLAVGKAVNSALDLETVLGIILASALELLEGSSGSIMLLEGPERLRVLCQVGNEEARDAVVRLGEGIAGQVAERREPMLISGTVGRDRSRGRRAVAVTSAICVPLI